MEKIMKISAQNQKRAWEIVEDTDIVNIWKSVGAQANLVGSLSMGLMVKHRDIDFHIYSNPLTISDSFLAMSRLAENPSIKHIEYTNLIETEEKCIEWHAWYQDKDSELWQIDMIHILGGSFYDGYMENVAKRILDTLTIETKEAILRLKYETPETERIMGIEYYKAVLGDGIRSYKDFEEWRSNNPVTGVVHWIP